MNPIIKNIDKYFRIIFLRKKKIYISNYFHYIAWKDFHDYFGGSGSGYLLCEYFSSLGTLFLFVLIVPYLAIMYFGP